MIKLWLSRQKQKRYDRGYQLVAAQLVKSHGTHLFDLSIIYETPETDFQRGALAAIKDFEVTLDRSRA